MGDFTVREITADDREWLARFLEKNWGSTKIVSALEQARRLKPQIPLIGIDGIPLRDEIELELIL